MRVIQTRTSSRTRYWVTHALLPFLSACAAFVLFENTRIDRATLDPFYDPASRTFPLRGTSWFTFVFKDVLKSLVIALGVAVALGFVMSWRKRELVPWRRTMIYVLLALALAPLTVGLLKYSSCTHCPWSLDLYGGKAPYVGLTGCPPPAFGRGQCFPGGHASGGYAVFALYFAHRVHAPRRALVWLVAALVYGSIMGVSRMMQGAHFLSHGIATGFVCWYVCLALYEIVLRRYDERRFAARSG